jgi:hypothetical protein
LQVAVTVDPVSGATVVGTVGETEAAAGDVVAVDVPQVATPWWPWHAPRRVAPEYSEPSLQVAVTLAAV